jgi:hypothetical protein
LMYMWGLCDAGIDQGIETLGNELGAGEAEKRVDAWRYKREK